MVNEVAESTYAVFESILCCNLESRRKEINPALPLACIERRSTLDSREQRDIDLEQTPATV